MNRHIAKRYTHAGLTLRLSEWAERTGISYGTLRRRIHKYKQPLEQAFTEPARRGRKPGFKPKARQVRAPRLVAISIEAVLRSWGRG